MLVLMRALAVFEGYDDKFRVTEADIVDHGLGPSPRFGVFVAEVDGAIVGIAVHYLIPWTYDLKPVVVLKELYVAEAARGMSVGHALVERLRDHATSIGASAIKWTVLKSNHAGEGFLSLAWRAARRNLGTLAADNRPIRHGPVERSAPYGRRYDIVSSLRCMAAI